MQFTVEPIGVVRSGVSDPAQMPGEGVPATIEVEPRFAAGLAGLADNSHVSVTAWLGGAARDLLTAHPKGSAAPRGVFATRSPHRPNPLGVSLARLLRVEGNTLHLAALDFVDGTPVLDLKAPLRGWDYAWSGVGFRDRQFASEEDEVWALDLLLREAEGFHGERCSGLALGVRLVWHAMRHFGIAARDADLRATVGVDGHVADAVQALTGATLGNGRLRPSTATAFHLQYGERELRFYLHDLAGRDAAAVLRAEPATLFSVAEVPAGHEPADAPVPARALSPAEREAALVALRQYLVNGKLPCPVAFKLARDLGLGTRQLGQLANEEGFRIAQCQLGCFR
ncbi:MAG: TrmO family methyltransferase domain-containing protein [Chloroflexota bacterium]